MTTLENHLWQALISAINYIPKSSENAFCHRGICSEMKCIRCSNARFIYAALQAGYNAQDKDIIKAELPDKSNVTR